MKVKLFSAHIDDAKKLQDEMNEFMSTRKVVEVKTSSNRQFLLDFVVVYEDS